jgi:hypothetical protein
LFANSKPSFAAATVLFARRRVALRSTQRRYASLRLLASHRKSLAALGEFMFSIGFCSLTGQLLDSGRPRTVFGIPNFPQLTESGNCGTVDAI